MFLVKDKKVGLILNDPPLGENFLAAFGLQSGAVEITEPYEWFGEYRTAQLNLRAAIDAAGTPKRIGCIYPFTAPPYAGAWDGASNFSRVICSGNYRFSGEVSGDMQAVYLAILRDDEVFYSAGHLALSEVRITAWSTSRGTKTSIIPQGGYWAVRQRGDVLLSFPREPHDGGQVDTLGRW